MLKSCVAWIAAVGAISFSALPAFALSVDVLPGQPSLVGAEHTFHAVVTDAVDPVTLQWQFGDMAMPVSGTLDMPFTFTAPGHYSVSVTAKDATGAESSWSFIHLAHHPLTPKRPAASSPIIYDAARNRVFSVNQDNDTVTAIDTSELTKVGEVAVYKRPESLALTPAGKLWVVHQDDYAVAVIDPERFVVESGFRLPYASQPVAIAVSPVGDAAYVTLAALGKLLKLDPTTGAVLGEVSVGPSPRGIAVSHDGKDVYVSRFISPDTGGEVVKVDATLMQVATRLVLKVDAETMDNAQKARGLPNYLFNVAVSPDGRQAWVPGKKDNILRGEKRDAQKLTHDTIVRPLAASFDLLTGQEMFHKRVDLDDRSPPVHVEFSPLGNLVFLTVGGSNKIEIRDTESPAGKAFTTISDVGWFPRATVLGPNNRLFVQSALSREIRVYNLSSALEFFDAATPSEVAVIPAVATEKLPADVLTGKKIFHFSEDDRMSLEKYMSCGACHFEGIDDGRVYDFSDRGEGFRNTFSL
ncbi:MAG TPA: PKD domain-containing protein, partial [Polyangiaceae bacterium]